jgi:hypothetical protein
VFLDVHSLLKIELPFFLLARAHDGDFAIDLSHRNGSGAIRHRVTANGGNGPR